MWRHIEFESGSNPYISVTDDNFAWMVFHYDVEINEVRPGVVYCTAHDAKPATTYAEHKARIENLAKSYQDASSEGSEYWADVAEWGEFFTYYGKRYGLMRAFRENGIC